MAGRSILVAILLCVLAAGCGGGGGTKYTYSFASSDTGAAAKNIYIKLISPVKIDASAFKGDKLIDHVSGPKDCSITQTVTKPPAKFAELQGKKVTIEVYGTNPLASLVCSLAKKGANDFFKGS